MESFYRNPSNIYLFKGNRNTRMFAGNKSSQRRCSAKKVLLEISQNSHEKTCTRVSFLMKLQFLACNFIKKETVAQVFSCEFYEISKNTIFTEHLWATASTKCYFHRKFLNDDVYLYPKTKYIK